MTKVDEQAELPKAAPDFTVRLAERSDAPAILRLLNETSLAGDRRIYRFNGPEGHRRVYSKLAVWVAVALGDVIGTIAFGVKQVTSGGRIVTIGYLHHARVTSSWQRSGVGYALTSAVRNWVPSQGLSAGLMSIGEENLPALSLAKGQGLVDVGTVTYLRVQRSAAAPSSAVGVKTVDVSRSPEWRSRIEQQFGVRDLCPTPFIELLYTPLRFGGYVETVWTRARGKYVWASVWDKDRALERETIDPGDRTLWIYDLVAPDPDDVAHLIADVFARHDNIGRLSLVMTDTDHAPDLAARIGGIYAVESHTEHLFLTPAIANRPIYLDVRD